MDLTFSFDATRFALGLAALFLVLAAMLIYDARAIKREPAKAADLLFAHIILLAFGAACAGFLTYRLSLSTCQPIPAATVERVLDHLNTPAEVAK